MLAVTALTIKHLCCPNFQCGKAECLLVASPTAHRNHPVPPGVEEHEGLLELGHLVVGERGLARHRDAGVDQPC